MVVTNPRGAKAYRGENESAGSGLIVVVALFIGLLGLNS